MPSVKSVGKPCAGEPHARFDGRGLETDRASRNRASPRPSEIVTLLVSGGSGTVEPAGGQGGHR
jgi:hypothetical protein